MRPTWTTKISSVLLALLVSLPHPLWAGPRAEDSTGRDETHVYHLSHNLSLISTLKIEDKLHLFIKLVYPQLQSQSMQKEANYFNQLVNDQVRDQIADLKKSVSSHQASATPRLKHRMNELYFDYNSSYILAHNQSLISVRFSTERYIVGMAHPAHQHDVLNYDLSNQSVLQLTDLFHTDSPYLTVLSNYTRKALAKKHLPNTAMLKAGTTPTRDHFRNWNIHPDGLLITFDEAQVAPYVYGAQTVLVPYAALKTLIKPDSPIAYCVIHQHGCRGAYLSTGGFPQ